MRVRYSVRMLLLSELKTQALRYVVLGELARAFRTYETIIGAVPTDLDARMKVADLCVSAGQPELARRVYAAVAYYDLQGGRPLHALVAAQALASLSPAATLESLHDSLAQLYGQGSPRLGQGARLAPPDPQTPVPPPDYSRTDLAEAAQAAAAAAASTTSVAELPTQFPPVPLLSELAPATLARVLKAGIVRRLAHGAEVVQMGAVGQSFYFVAAGAVRVYRRDEAGQEQELGRLGEGALFGELALLAAQPRSASVAVVGEADLIEFGAAALRAAAEELPQLAAVLHRFTRERLLKNLLANSPLFRPFSQQQRIDLARRFTGHEIASGAAIIREGDPGRGLYVVLAGEVEVLKGEGPVATRLATLGAGDLFGEISLVRGTPTTATVRAVGPTTVLFLGRDYFERLIVALPEIRAFFEELTEERLHASALLTVEEAPLLL